MRKSVMFSIVLHAVAGAVSCLWLLWFFIPVGNLFKILTTLGIVVLAGGYMWKHGQWHNDQDSGECTENDFPELDTQVPVVLVCGDGLDALFQGKQLRKTAQGWWLRTDNISALSDMISNVVEQQPRQVGQISVMHVCQPDQHQDVAVLRESLRVLRHQVSLAGKLTGFPLPVLVCGEFSGPETPWVTIRGDQSVVNPVGDTPQALADWQQTGKNLSALPVLIQAFCFVRETLLDELGKADRLYPALAPFAIALRTGCTLPQETSVWSEWLQTRTCLLLPVTGTDSPPAGRFPDALLPLLAPYCAPVQGGQRTRRLILLLLICALAALGLSAVNNRDLIARVSTDLQRWNVIPMNHYVPKAQALTALQQDALLLERWQRQGEPRNLGLGYFPGSRLWLALQQAIDTYVPSPAIKSKPVAQIVRLDSLSLFDSGKARLKEGSINVLINALLGIKAKPGWLIVVSGHTDNTGSAQFNQMLSRQRADAVRNWMRDSGSVPESCFAVQGYGDSRPIASNDTPEGRAQNRRVEISLVPQANACRMPDVNPSSSRDGDGSQH